MADRAGVLKPLRTVLAYLRIFGPLGALHLAFCLVSRRRKLVRVATRWSSHPLFVRLNTSDINVFRQVFLEQEYAITRLIGEPLDTIIDAGANIGLTSVYLADRHPGARIYALEPDAGNFEVLRQNTCTSGQVHCVRGALWNRDEPLVLDTELADWAFQVKPAGASAAHRVEGWRLSTFMDRNGIQRASLLKMDIEGAEHEVLGDAPGWIARVDSMVVELHEGLRPGCSALFAQVTAAFPTRAAGGELTLVSRAPPAGPAA